MLLQVRSTKIGGGYIGDLQTVTVLNRVPGLCWHLLIALSSRSLSQGSAPLALLAFRPTSTDASFQSCICNKLYTYC